MAQRLSGPAAFNGHADVVQTLLAAEANVDGDPKMSKTPLQAAQNARHDDVAALLVRHGGHA